MKPLNAKVAVERCSSLAETSSDASLLSKTLSEFSLDCSLLSMTLFDEIALEEISWLDRHSSLEIIIIIIIQPNMVVSITNHHTI